MARNASGVQSEASRLRRFSCRSACPGQALCRRCQHLHSTEMQLCPHSSSADTSGGCWEPHIGFFPVPQHFCRLITSCRLQEPFSAAHNHFCIAANELCHEGMQDGASEGIKVLIRLELAPLIRGPEEWSHYAPGWAGGPQRAALAQLHIRGSHFFSL